MIDWKPVSSSAIDRIAYDRNALCYLLISKIALPNIPIEMFQKVYSLSFLRHPPKVIFITAS